MALDQIWKQQLTLVTYGNEYLAQDLSFSRWLKHSIFNQHALDFKDLTSQHLLAQHFQVWLEGLKKQGVYQLSLHCSSLLNDEQNPNSNVELLAISHFIVSHNQHKKTAWIFGKELAEWYTADQDYDIPAEQRSNLRHETFWRFELHGKLIQRIEKDFIAPNWDDIHVYTENELFTTSYAAGFQEPLNHQAYYYGMPIPQNSDHEMNAQQDYLSLLPTNYQASYAHENLTRLEHLSNFIQAKIQHPYDENEVILSPDAQLNLRHFSQKLDELSSKFIVKVANHYQSARLTPQQISSPLDSIDRSTEAKHRFGTKSKNSEHKVGKTSVLTLIMITIMICLAAYYFGL